LANGTTKQIADVREGDLVLATDPETGKTSARTVTATMSHDDNDLLDLTIRDGDGHHGVLQTTDHHEMWSVTAGAWVLAKDLHEGDQLHEPDGTTATLIEATKRPGHQEMLDLTVEHDHTFYVDYGGDAILVHNKCVNLPSWKKLEVDMEHIKSGHVEGGARVSPNKGLFENMNDGQINNAIRDAYNNGSRVQTQIGGDGATRVLVRGEGGGRTIEMWVNTTTNVVETAYPI
jgi:hypothetical protein